MYNKINIVESKYPPTNKNDWWYDLNDGILKRFSGGKYNSVVGEGGNTSWIPVPDLYANISSNELLIFSEDGEDATPNVSISSIDGYEVESKEYDPEIGAWVLTLPVDMTEFEEVLLELYITNTNPNMVVVFPQSLETIYYKGIRVTCNDESTTLVFTSKNLKMADSSIIYEDGASSSNSLSVITYSYNPITTNFIMDDIEEPVWEAPIYVQPSLLEEYKNMPINENYNIQPID